jgi:polyphosphate:AMP phosphotransferase
MLHEVLSGKRLTKAQYERRLPKLRDQLLDAQFDLRKSRKRAVVVIATQIPGAGRSDVVNELLEWLDPKFVSVYGFREPNEVERQRPTLWRYWRIMPPRGRISILDAGWYQELMLPALLEKTSVVEDLHRDVERIRRLERMLVQDGVAVVKLHMHVSPEVQRKRLHKLHKDPATRWRVTRQDRWLAKHYERVERVIEQVIEATNQPEAPWLLIDGTDPEHRAYETGRWLLAAMENGAGRVARAKRVGPTARQKRLAASLKLRSAASGPTKSADEYQRELESLQGRLALLSRRKGFAKRSAVVVFEGMDAAGKGGSIRRITAALDARQDRIVPVSAPTEEEALRPYLWRFWFHLPPRGNYTIFDRSWYGRVLVERVRGFAAEPDWRRAYDEINEFELELHEHKVIVAKFWMTVSPAVQLERFKERDRNPLKRFKVDAEDWANRKLWKGYEAAARDMLALTDTPHAPWTIVPADDKRYARPLVLRHLCESIETALG